MGAVVRVAGMAPGAGAIVAQSLVLFTVAKGLGALLMIWSEKPASA